MFTAPPGFHERLVAEIQSTIQAMRNVPGVQREYHVGFLTALIWAHGCGHVQRSTAHIQACEWWDKMREES
jgi:hypothetical protein